MLFLRIISALPLLGISAYILLSAGLLLFNTSGQVFSTEFNMLISIAHSIGLLLLWLSCFAVWTIAAHLLPKPKEMIR